jgi:hypothetical protein
MLGISQMVAWGSSFFLPAILAVPMARELGLAPSIVFAAFSLSLIVAWLLMGLAMAGGLLEAAFSTLVELYGREARRGMTGITLITGFTGTLCWPLTTLLEAQFGWRGACFLGRDASADRAALNAWLPRAPAHLRRRRPLRKLPISPRPTRHRR